MSIRRIWIAWVEEILGAEEGKSIVTWRVLKRDGGIEVTRGWEEIVEISNFEEATT